MTMAKEKLKVIKQAEITNNCPECFNQDMVLSFSQKHLYSRFYHKITAEIQHEIKCNKCESVIYPVKWTDDIERIFEYYQKTVVPEKAGIIFTPWFYLLWFGLIAIIVVLYYLFSNEIIQF